MSLLGGFEWSAHMRGWAVLDGLCSKELSELFGRMLRCVCLV